MTCRTVAEAFAAGQRDGENDPPLSREQVIYIARLLGRDRPAPVPVLATTP